MAKIPFSTRALSLNPVGGYDFSELSGAFVNLGSAGSGGNLAVTGTPTRGAASLLKSGIGTAARFNTGSATSGSVFSATAGASMVGIIEFQSMSNSTSNLVILGATGSNRASLGIRQYVGQNIQFYAGTTGAGNTGQTLIELNRKYFFSITYDYVKKLVSHYLDGFLIKESYLSSGVNPFPLSNDSLKITSVSGTDFTLDEVAVYDYVLSQAEVNSLFRSARNIDENQTTFYCGGAGTTFGTGEIGDTLSFDYLDVFGLLQYTEGVQVIFTGTEGAIVQNKSLSFQNITGKIDNRVKFKPADGERVDLHTTGIGNTRTISFENSCEDFDLIGRGYGAPGILAGLVISCPKDKYIAFANGTSHGDNPAFDGSISNKDVTLTGILACFHKSHEGLTAVISNYANVILTTTIETVTDGLHAILTDSLNQTVTLSTTGWNIALIKNEMVTIAAGLETYGRRGRFINLMMKGLENLLSDWLGATDTVMYGCVLKDAGWFDPNRGHGQGLSYTQNQLPSIKFYSHNIGRTIGARNLRIDSVSQPASGYTVERNSLMLSITNMIYRCGLQPTGTYLADVAAGSSSFNFTKTSGAALAQGDNIQIYGAGKSGQDYYGLVRSVAGGTATVFPPIETNVTNTEVRKCDKNDLNTDVILFGTSTRTYPTEKAVARYNCFTKPLIGVNGGGATFGYNSANVDLELTENEFGDSVALNEWQKITSSKNRFLYNYFDENESGTQKAGALTADTTGGGAPSAGNWQFTEDEYYLPLNGGASPVSSFTRSPNATNNTFAQWQAAGYDTNGTYNYSLPPDKVFVHPHDIEYSPQGTANIYIRAYSKPNSVTVDLSLTGLVHGQGYQLRDIDTFFDDTKAIEGIFDVNNPNITLDISGIDIEQRFGWTENGLRPVPSFKAFGIADFLVIPFVPPTVSGAPNAPTNLAISRLTNKSIMLSWSNNGDVTSDVILEYKKVTDTAFTVLPLVAGTENYTFPNITAPRGRKLYQFRVKLSNPSGVSLDTAIGVKTLTQVNDIGNAPTQVG